MHLLYLQPDHPACRLMDFLTNKRMAFENSSKQVPDLISFRSYGALPGGFAYCYTLQRGFSLNGLDGRFIARTELIP